MVMTDTKQDEVVGGLEMETWKYLLFGLGLTNLFALWFDHGQHRPLGLLSYAALNSSNSIFTGVISWLSFNVFIGRKVDDWVCPPASSSSFFLNLLGRCTIDHV
jgi:hypothetical protein